MIGDSPLRSKPSTIVDQRGGEPHVTAQGPARSCCPTVLVETSDGPTGAQNSRTL